jgi:hypothetical protein
MVFRTPPARESVPETPDQLLRDLSRRKIPDVLPHQAEVMQKYATDGLEKRDVAFQLPTGSGKTLVGLLIAEWRRRKFQERIVYLCPTRQLVHQVAEQAEDKYGISVEVFVGRQRDYTPASKTNYQQAEKIAITTYSGVFNTNSFFSDAHTLLLDDAHAAENYIASYWTMRVERSEEEHRALHVALCNLLAPHLTATNLSRLRGSWQDIADRTWVDMLPTPVLQSIRGDLIAILDAHTQGNDLQYCWSVLREHVDACHVYLSSDDILIRPLLPPTFSHPPFENASHRIYMSATLGAGGDLERLTGCGHIHRLGAPKGWDTQGVGRRFFIFPEMSLSDEEVQGLRLAMIEHARRALVLVPRKALAEEIASSIENGLGATIFRAKDIEESKGRFVGSDNAVAIIANRYDGVDFAGNECRLLFIEGLPKATNAQERFLMTRMGANTLFNERVQTRVIQAIGRCTRSLEDYSAVVVTGEELPDYLSDIRRRHFLHPELQAEIEFGVHQSKDMSFEDMLENFSTFLRNDREWEQVNQTIVEARKHKDRKELPAIAELHESVQYEVQYQAAIWRGDNVSALQFAEQVLGTLADPALRGYRALWHYLAGSAAWLADRQGQAAVGNKARHHFAQAHKCAPDIRWLTEFTRTAVPEDVQRDPDAGVIQEQVERIAGEINRLGRSHDRKFAELEKSILEGMQHPDHFEEAQRMLGQLLGAHAGKVEQEGSPDPWWICGDCCIVFEDYVDTDENGALDVRKTRQASSHPDWMKAHIEESRDCRIIPVLVTPARYIREAAVAHAADLLLWPYTEFVKWAQKALATVREFRATFFEMGDLVWQAELATALKDRELDFPSIIRRLEQNRVIEVMEQRAAG